MAEPIADRVIDFYSALFRRVFSDRFEPKILDRLKRKAVARQVEEAADAASQSLTRFFLNEQLTEACVAEILAGFSDLGNLLILDDIANPNVTPESLVEALLPRVPCPEGVDLGGAGPVYRVALHSIVQVLTLVGSVMAEWQKLGFSTTFELPRKVVNRLNQISDQLQALGQAGQAAADERYELTYRDYLMQRFHRVEAGTVRMTTNLDVDLSELFVMPRVRVRAAGGKDDKTAGSDAEALMGLGAARELFSSTPKDKENPGVPALGHVRASSRTVIVGPPGSGKSTFLEWLQLKTASIEEEMIAGEGQVIPLLLRVRQMDPRNLPRGAALVAQATASQDRAKLMPWGWLDRKMKDGRVLLMIDGLDEAELELRDKCILPWLAALCRQYPDCRYIVSSRPVGYPTGALTTLGFTECDLLDFDDAQITQYTQHWCTAIRLARNEIEAEARREGEADGRRIVDGFKEHAYIRNLARNPLMLSAICLVNYFEGGELPKDRSLLYRLCVEGLLHNWDQRRGIHSEFSLAEKLRVCREVALAMQADDRAEYEAAKVREIFAEVLRDSARGNQLLEHIRYRTGLLLERRPGIFAFAHLTFQEFLAPLAVHEGNHLGVDPERLVREHDDGRWREVIALYCGIAPAPAVRHVLVELLAQKDTGALSSVLAEAYLSSGSEIGNDVELRQRVLSRIARAPGRHPPPLLRRFPDEVVRPIAYDCLGTIESAHISEAYRWLWTEGDRIDSQALVRRLQNWPAMTPVQISEILYLVHFRGDDVGLREVAQWGDLYISPGPDFDWARYGIQGEVALNGLSDRQKKYGPGALDAGLRALRTLSETETYSHQFVFVLWNFLKSTTPAARVAGSQLEFAAAARALATHLSTVQLSRQTSPPDAKVDDPIELLIKWADDLESDANINEQSEAQLPDDSR